MIASEVIVSPGASAGGTNVSLVQPGALPGLCAAAAQPRKYVVTFVVTFQRGAPAPQCPSSRCSQESPVNGCPSMPLTTAMAAANVAVGTFFSNSSAWAALPVESCWPCLAFQLACDFLPKPLGCSFRPSADAVAGSAMASATAATKGA